jgi:hypothetical protein
MAVGAPLNSPRRAKELRADELREFCAKVFPPAAKSALHHRENHRRGCSEFAASLVSLGWRQQSAFLNPTPKGES